MKHIELDIYWLEGFANQKKELGLELEKGDATTKKVTFFTIDNISETDYHDEKVGCVSSGGQEYLTTLSLEELKHRILHNF